MLGSRSPAPGGGSASALIGASGIRFGCNDRLAHLRKEKICGSRGVIRKVSGFGFDEEAHRYDRCGYGGFESTEGSQASSWHRRGEETQGERCKRTPNCCESFRKDNGNKSTNAGKRLSWLPNHGNLAPKVIPRLLFRFWKLAVGGSSKMLSLSWRRFLISSFVKSIETQCFRFALTCGSKFLKKSLRNPQNTRKVEIVMFAQKSGTSVLTPATSSYHSLPAHQSLLLCVVSKLIRLHCTTQLLYCFLWNKLCSLS